MPDIQQKQNSSQVILYDAEHFPSPTSNIFSVHHWIEQDSIIGQAMGRGTTYFFKHNDKEYVLRHYRRGGLIGKMLGDQYLYSGLTRTRPWQEFHLLKDMQQLNLPCPRPIAALVTKHAFYYQADIISVKIPQAQDLYDILSTRPLDSAVWRDIGTTIATFHNQKIYHHDLNMHNIMLDKHQQTWLIDFDKCTFKQGNSWKSSNIARLKRSFEKEKKLKDIHWQPSNWDFLLNGYKEKLNV